MLHPPLDREEMIKTQNPEFTRKNVEALAEWQGNPDWLRQLRLQYFELFEQLPMPGRKDETWRRTDISGLEYEKYVPFRPGDTGTYDESNLPAAVASHFPQENQISALFLNVDGQIVLSKKLNELRKKGVIWTDLKSAAREFPELVQKYLLKSIDAADESKFTALNAAFWNSGMFLYVPKNVELDLPLHVINWLRSAEMVHTPHTLIVLDQGATATYFEEILSDADQEGQSWVNGVVEIFVEPAARLQYISSQNLSNSVYNFAHRRAVINRDGVMNWMVGTFGSQLTKSTISSILKGEGAETQMLGIAIGEKERFIDQDTHQIHDAPHTRSDLLFKSAILEGGRTVYRGVIRIAQHAQRSDAYQANRNLMLGDNAKAESIPALEIIANDVRCTHGATVGKIDPEQLFYLQSRGLSRAEAKKLLVNGFFVPVLQNIPHEYIHGRLTAIIEQRTQAVEI